jgi:predicted nucleic acid binding AN1-type Zn finger protein
VKETVEVDDDMAFLDSVVQLNQTCAFDQCSVNISEISFNACRTCQKVFCPKHVVPSVHACDQSNPIKGGQKSQSNAQRTKANKLLEELQSQRRAKVPQKNKK